MFLKKTKKLVFFFKKLFTNMKLGVIINGH